MRKHDLVVVLNAIAAGLGLGGLLAPAATQRSFGAVPTPVTNGATRMISSRNLVLSALISRSDEKTIDDLLRLGVAMNLADAGSAVFTGVMHRDVPRRQVVSLAATCGVFAAAELWALRLD